MKKFMLGLGVILFTTSALAESSVILYGVLDVSAAYVSSEASKLGVPGAHIFQLSSGPQGTNRWGLRGIEDLGGGTRAVFTLESGFSLTNGMSLQGNREFGVMSYVGLDDDRYGRLTLGRQYDVGFDLVGAFASSRLFAGQYGAHIGDPDEMFSTFRYNNSVKYVSPDMSGVQASAMYAFSNQAAGNDGTGFSNNRSYSTGIRYAGKSPLSAAIAYTELSNPSSASNTGGAVSGDYGVVPNTNIFYLSTVTAQRIFAAALGYRFGSAGANFLYTYTRIRYIDNTTINLSNYEVNATFNITPAILLGAAYIYTAGSGDGGDSTNSIASGNRPKWNQLQAGVHYLLSKSTDVYLIALYQRAAGDAKVAALETSGGFANSGLQFVTEIGLRKKF